MPKWRNFAKSGRAASHDGRNRGNEEKILISVRRIFLSLKTIKQAAAKERKEKQMQRSTSSHFPEWGTPRKKKMY